MDGSMKVTNAANILIIDDVETNRVILEKIILKMGCCPVMAGSAIQALEIIPECRPKLILSDISMPEMDGYELCRILKKDPKTREIPIIFISAFDDPKEIVKGFSLGARIILRSLLFPKSCRRG